MPSPQQNPEARAIESEMEAVYCLYAGMACWMEAETGAGGKLLYAGQPDAPGCRLLRAANIAGAASLASCAAAPALRRAMQEGAIDFVVTSLDEALRILKNQIRKKQPVAVGVSVAPELLLREMAERGVQPDLLAPQVLDQPHPPDAPEIAAFLVGGARRVQPLRLPQGKHFLALPHDGKQPISAFDARLLDDLAPDDHVQRRWVRLAPRYLPAAARRLRLVVVADH